MKSDTWFRYLTENSADVAAACDQEMVRVASRYAPTPTGRLADLALEALDANDTRMVRTCLLRLLELGGKT